MSKYYEEGSLYWDEDGNAQNENLEIKDGKITLARKPIFKLGDTIYYFDGKSFRNAETGEIKEVENETKDSQFMNRE